MFSAYDLGATLYMPVIHRKVPDIVSGLAPAPASSIVLCLEAALHEADVERGVRILAGLLKDGRGRGEAGPRLFIRPRSFDMACRLRAMDGITRVDGLILTVEAEDERAKVAGEQNRRHWARIWRD